MKMRPIVATALTLSVVASATVLASRYQGGKTPSQLSEEMRKAKMAELKETILAKTKIATDVYEVNKKVMNLQCYTTERISGFSIGKNTPSKTDGKVAIQSFSHEDNQYDLRVINSDGENVTVTLNKGEQSLGEYQVEKSVLHFHDEMIDTKKASAIFGLPVLEKMKCYFGSENYFVTLEGDANISMHYTRGFFKPKLEYTPEYEEYFYSEREGTKVVAMHGRSRRSYYDSYRLHKNDMELFYKQIGGKRADKSLLGRKEVPTEYKISPVGHLHYNLQTDNVMIMGGFLNQCITNTIGLLGRSLLGSPFDELKVNISERYAFYQPIGMTKRGIDVNLNLGFAGTTYPFFKKMGLSETAPVKNLVHNKTRSLRKYWFKKNWKKYLEEVNSSEIEVLFEGEERTTDKPVLRLLFKK